MKKTLAEYAKDDGYEDEQGLFYQDAEGLIQAGLLDFCCCGCPTENLLYVLGGLELIEQRRSMPEYGHDPTGWDAWYKAHTARELAHFGSDAATYFFWYWCAAQKLTEHGGSVPGWLDRKGEGLLGLLREWKSSQPKDDREHSDFPA